MCPVTNPLWLWISSFTKAETKTNQKTKQNTKQQQQPPQHTHRQKKTQPKNNKKATNQANKTNKETKKPATPHRHTQKKTPFLWNILKFLQVLMHLEPFTIWRGLYPLNQLLFLKSWSPRWSAPNTGTFVHPEVWGAVTRGTAAY